MISMLGVIPTKCKNQSLYLEPLLRMFNSLKPGRPGVRIRSPSGDLETWWAMIAVTINDMQGISSVNRQRQFPGKVMACNDCAVRGMNPVCYKTTMYPCAVAFLPMDDPLRAQYQRTFRRSSRLKGLAEADGIREITDRYIRLAMQYAELSPHAPTSMHHPVHTYGFKGRSVFVKCLDYWRPWMMNFRDTDHMLLNRMRLIISLLQGDNNFQMNPEKMRFEVSLGRFHRYAPRTTVVDGKSTTKLPKQPWRAKKSEIRFVDEVLPRYVRLPDSIKNGKIASYFTDTLTCTFADAVIFFWLWENYPVPHAVNLRCTEGSAE